MEYKVKKTCENCVYYGVGTTCSTDERKIKFDFNEGKCWVGNLEEETESIDKVNHPAHYTSHPSGIECIEITQHYDFCIGNAIKYLWRAGIKTEAGMTDKEKQIEDLQKAIWYINNEIKLLSK